MSCREALQRIADLLAGRLPPEAREDLDRHLAGCDACRAALIDARAGAGALSDLARAEADRPVRPTDVAAILAMAQAHDETRALGTGGRSPRAAARPLGARLARVAAALLIALGLAALANTQVHVGGGRLDVTCRAPWVSAPPALPTPGPAGSSDLWQEAERALRVSNGGPDGGPVGAYTADADLDDRIGRALDARLYPIMAHFGTRLEEGDAQRTQALIALLERQAADNARALELLRRVTTLDPDQPAILMPVAGPARRLKE